MREPVVFERASLDDLLAALRRRGYTLIGPTVRQRAVVYDEISSAADLPAGVTDEQDGGTYRLAQSGGGALFSHNVGPSSWKGQLFPPRLRLWHARRGDDGAMEIKQEQPDARPRAFIGVRSCDLHAIAVQDRTFIGGAHVDADYAARRAAIFVVAVNCSQSASTCFCVSMDTGPKAQDGFDLALTELLDDDNGHRFVVEVGSARGAEVLAEVPTRPAAGSDHAGADAVVQRAASQQVRKLDTTDIRNLLLGNLEHPRWDDVAERCLSCGNCTQVCPTCFCSTVEDVTDLAGGEAGHERVWDSCFSLEQSHIHGGSVRATTRSRYRQWMTHKLATWIDQFGTSGCVGCGRCIAWCPVAIDLTEEVAAIRSSDEREAGARAGD